MMQFFMIKVGKYEVGVLAEDRFDAYELATEWVTDYIRRVN